MRRARRLGALAVSVLAATTALGGSASADTVQSFHTSLDPASVRESVRYLVENYRVSEQEALRRLELQTDSGKLDELLRRDRGAEYGGMWLDQDSGQLVVAMTEPAAAEPYLKAMPDRSAVRTQRVQHSLQQLTAAKERVAAKVGAGPDAVYLPSVSESENRVVLWERDWVARENAVVATEANTAQRAAADESGMVVPRVLKNPNALSTPNVDLGFCHPLYCTNYGPMRGGIRLDMKRDDGTWGGCTSGFNLRSTGGGFPGKGWVLTAGHCMRTKTNNTPTQHNGNDVLQQHGIEKSSYPYDYAALPYVNDAASTQWLEGQTGRNRVLKYCRNGGMDSNGDTPCGAQATSVDEYITSARKLADIKAGYVVCASGTASSKVNYPDSVDSGAGAGYLVGTRCGRVLSTDVGINTDLCARPGDSGGPLFSQADHAALGILVGNQQSRSGPCQAGELNNYAPIETITTDLSERIASQGSTFAVITTPNG
ncbi:trypsin-like serine protease [Amycolatopsis sp. EV170708-02-1]|uniref:trypsin-like serine protease n=1 Tax=Amycolatopsis sp. EV170708-02-1 TaxID=2919322 RepID=UPI001F0C2D25|nr:trypsin-like serine protease [Amycolatopsis sp. EV170708-02-1]UMP04746.1 S1 family peptidase [Amycolatopsis sp. EV170708-02-1]